MLPTKLPDVLRVFARYEDLFIKRFESLSHLCQTRRKLRDLTLLQRCSIDLRRCKARVHGLP